MRIQRIICDMRRGYLLLAALSLLTVASPALAASYRSTMSVVLDKPAVVASEPVKGVIRFRLDRTTPGGSRFVSLHQTRILLVKSENDRSAVPTGAVIKGRLPISLRLGQTYELPFKLDVNPGFRKSVSALGQYRLFHPGEFKVRGVVVSLPRPPDIKKSPVPITYVAGNWESGWTKVAVKNDTSPLLSREHVFDALRRAEPPHRETVMKFYAKAGVLQADDLVRLMAKAEPRARASMIAFYVSQKYPLEALDFFEPVSGEVALGGHADGPFFLAVQPKQTVMMRVNDPTGLHTVETATHRSGTIGLNRVVAIKAPRTRGLYPVRCRRHGEHWGWLLVRKSTSKPAAPTEAEAPQSRP